VVAAETLRSHGRAALLAATAAGIVAVLGVELLSRIGALQRGPVWCLLAAMGATAIAVVRREAPRGRDTGARAWALDLAIAVIGTTTLAVALVAAPNTWDSMTYHLPRVAHWAANGNVAHYPTSIDRQLWQPPFGEYLVLLAYVACGGDRLANLPGWLAAVGAAVAASEIARLLGRSAFERRLATFVVATTPGLVLEATSTQTDVVAAFWVAVVAYLSLAEWVSPSTEWTASAWIGAALALAIGTKGTALPFGLPWLAVALVAILRARGVGATIRAIAVTTTAVVGLSAASWLRNLLVFNGPLGPASVQTLLRPAGLDPATVIGNLAANLAIHLGTSWAAANAALEGAVRALHARLGLDVGALYPFFGGYALAEWNTHENVAGNPLELALAAIGAVLAVVAWRRRRRIEWAYLAGLALSLLLLGASVRWQPYNARLHLPLFVVLAPGIAMTLRAAGRIGAPIVVVALFLASTPALLANATRPVVASQLAMAGVESVFTTPRLDQYFAARRDALPVYAHLAAAARALDCRAYALKAGYDGWEYALARTLGVPRLDHAFVRNASTELGEKPLADGGCLVVVDERADWRPPDARRLVWAEGRAAIWR
jgi:hypothetical protein